MSADRYTLPAELGGGEVEVLHGMALEGSRVDCELDVVSLGVTIKLNLPYRLLTPVKPPLPPEPPDGSVVQINGKSYVRDDAEAAVPGEPEHWFFVELPYSWAELCKMAEPGVPVLLVPDPFAEPVQLPWRGLAKGIVSPTVLNVRPADGVVLSIERIGDEDNERWIWLDAETGKTVARAVWAAANQADKDGTE